MPLRMQRSVGKNAMEQLTGRKPNRLKNYDYTANGAYFITICVKDRKCILSRISVGADIIRPYQIQLTQSGQIVAKAIRSVSSHYDNVSIDHYVIMPNHVHLLLRIDESSGRIISAPTGSEACGRMISAPTDAEIGGRVISVSTVIGSLKRIVSKELGFSVWQKSYYDHVIRDERDYQIRWQYIENNPAKWAQDEYYTEDK